MERNEKGQFLPGNKEGISTEVAREYQARSVKARLANKKGAELVRELLRNKVSDPVVIAALKKAGYNVRQVTNELAMHVRQIEKAQKTGDTKAYTAVMKVAGYDESEKPSGVNININAPSTKDAKTIADWLAEDE